MSDLYLVLRTRLATMAEWVTLGPEMRRARERLGISRAAIAREIPVVEKTYERWEKRGQVPRPFLPTVAHLLHLEIEEPERIQVALAANGDIPPDQRFESLLDRLERIVEGLEGGQEQPPDD